MPTTGDSALNKISPCHLVRATGETANRLTAFRKYRGGAGRKRGARAGLSQLVSSSRAKWVLQ